MAKKRIRKAARAGASLGMKAARLGKIIAKDVGKVVARDVKDVFEKRFMTKQEAQKLLNEVVSALREEKQRIEKFAKQEMKRTKGKLKPVARKALRKVKK